MTEQPFIIGIGGTTRANSSSEMAVRYALARAREYGARTDQIVGSDLAFPMFAPELPHRTDGAARFVDLLRRSDGVIIASPGYHGSISGLIKNALDYTEDMRDDAATYLDGRAVGSIVCAAGWQTVGTALTTLRCIVHALRGWPTPMGVGINTAQRMFDDAGQCLDKGVAAHLDTVASQVVEFGYMRIARRHAVRPLHAMAN
jgi:FMN reductase